jgi:hypothetical protein
MGNIESSRNINRNKNIENINRKKISLPRLIDSIATMYILKQNFQDLKNLTDPKYCNDLVILTSDVIYDRLNELEVEYLSKRTHKGITVDDMRKDKVLFIDKNDLSRLDVQSSVKKRRLCIGIARFYVKIAHLFSAIIMTINPVYTYKNAYGSKEYVSYINKLNIPNEVRKKVHLNKMGLCARRIKSIVIDEIKDTSTKEKKYEIKNKICDLNKKDKYSKDGISKSETKTLIDEPGIPELYQLYMDKFDYNKNKFNIMSPESKKQYQNDLQLFYKVFTGKSSMPSNITKFSDIKLRDYHNTPACKGMNDAKGILREKYTENKKDQYMQNYAEKVARMTQNINYQNNKLIKILDEIFVYRIDPETKNKEITLYPKLNMEKLNSIIKIARNIIIELYVGCENDFLKALQSFETVVENQIKKNTENKIRNIKKTQELLLAEV